MNKLPLSAFTPEELAARTGVEKKFRGKQIFQWIHKGIFSIEEMTNLSKELRQSLEENWMVISSGIDQEFADPDGTVKLRFKMAGGEFVEAVLLKDQSERATLCISSQVGCRMGCKFCRTGQMKFKRNLEAFEIVEQFLLARARFGQISNIVFMGMGEPLDNTENVQQAITLLTHPDGTGIGQRKITLSTCGVIKGIREFTEKGPDVKLAVSLISANPKIRQTLMPVQKANPLADLKDALVQYQAKSGKRITLELVLLDGINCDDREIEHLIRFIPPLKAVVNVIPWNPAKGLDFKRPENQTISRFVDRLERRGINVTRRYRRGTGINAACGQLCPDED